MESLLAQWDVFARSNAPQGHGMSAQALRDHAEEILLAIAADIETEQCGGEQRRKSEGLCDNRGESATAAAVHGALREAGDFSLLQLTAEYRALRATVLREWMAVTAPLDAGHADQMLRLNEAVDQALAESVVAYEAQANRRRAQAEAALRDSEERYRTILATALDYAIFTTDSAGVIDSWPPGAQAVFGWSPEEAIGRDAAITYLADDRARSVPQHELDEARARGVAPNIRWHVRKGGQKVFIEGATRPLADRPSGGHGFLKVGRDVTERKHWDERQQVLLHELQHRTRNIMVVVLSMFEKTCRGSADIAELARTFKDRVAALARAQALLSRLHEGDRVAFDTLIRTELSAMGALDADGFGQRVELAGPAGVLLRSHSVQTFALALHELATNATKYGALAQESGRLSVRWRVRRSMGRPSLHIEWTESGVDMAVAGRAARGSGYGRELIERALPYQLEARTTYVLDTDGVKCTIALPISDATSLETCSHA